MARTDATARYRQAWQFGSEGKTLPPRLSELADQDPLVDVAADAGRSKVPFDTFLSANGLAGSAPRSSPSSSPVSAPSPRSSSGSGGGFASIGENFGSVLLGLLGGALVLSVFDYGAGGPLLWFKAKFLNDASGAAPHSSTSSAATALPIVGAG